MAPGVGFESIRPEHVLVGYRPGEVTLAAEHQSAAARDQKSSQIRPFEERHGEVRPLEVRPFKICPRFDRVAADLHDNHATGQPTALPERLPWPHRMGVKNPQHAPRSTLRLRQGVCCPGFQLFWSFCLFRTGSTKPVQASVGRRELRRENPTRSPIVFGREPKPRLQDPWLHDRPGTKPASDCRDRCRRSGTDD